MLKPFNAILAVTILLSCSLISPHAKAEAVSANMLRAACNYPSLPEKYQANAKQMCHLTIRNYLEYNAAMKNFIGTKVPFCLSEGGASLVGARSTFMGFVASNPNLLEEPAAIVFMLAMSEVSKCE